MLQLVALALIGAGAYAGYRWIARVARQAAVEAEQRAASARSAAQSIEPRDLGELEWDARAGVYRPREARSA